LRRSNPQERAWTSLVRTPDHLLRLLILTAYLVVGALAVIAIRKQKFESSALAEADASAAAAGAIV
jgi:hypothetical protein